MHNPHVGAIAYNKYSRHIFVFEILSCFIIVNLTISRNYFFIYFIWRRRVYNITKVLQFPCLELLAVSLKKTSKLTLDNAWQETDVSRQ